MDILAVIPTIYSEKSCIQLLKNLEVKDHNLLILLIDNSIATYSLKFFDYVGQRKDIFYFKPTINLGFSNSVNFGLNFGYKTFNFGLVMFINDDVIVNDKNEFNKFVNFSLDSDSLVTLTDFGRQKSPWSLMTIKKKCYEEIGGWDSNLFPTCCEDKDYNMRYIKHYGKAPAIYKTKGLSHTVRPRPRKKIMAVSFKGYKMCLPYFLKKWKGTDKRFLNLFHFDKNTIIKQNKVPKSEIEKVRTPGYNWFYNDEHNK